MTVSIEDVLNRLDEVRPRGREQWQALCPAHDDRNPSLSVTVGDGGKVLLHCHAGCAYPNILTALGLPVNGNGQDREMSLAEKRPKTVKAKVATGPIVATYDYQDAAGKVLFQKVRHEPKSFGIRRPNGRGGWLWGLGDIQPVLYRLPQLIDAENDWQPVYICEGEKDCDRLAKLGLIATCNFDGAATAGQRSKWRPEYNEYFAGRVVYILADNDDAGRAHSESIAGNLHEITQAVKVVRLPDLPDKGDISDWLDMGHTKDDLEYTCLTTPMWDAADSMNAAVLSAAIPVQQESPFKLDDTGNAERFVAKHSETVRYDHSTGHWLIWTGTHWRRDDNGEAQRLAKATARAIYEEAAEAAKVGRDELAAQLAKWARTSGQESRRNAMLNLARSELPIAITHDRLNRNELLLNVQNGTLDLATVALRPHDRAELLTYVLPAVYNPAAVCPTWDAFIERITSGNKATADFLARAVGYTFSGSTAEQCLFFLFGRGANGKSTFIETVMTLLGDLGHKARAQVLMQDERERVPNEIAALAGKRLVVASELADGGRLNEGLVKDMTGGDTMSARFLYGEPFTFRPSFKLWLYGNHKPVITGTDDGIWRRIRLIPFTVQIPEDERDPALSAKLRQELPGILAWAIRGWQDYQRRGLDAPAAVTGATADYRADSDTLGLFLDERCIMGADKSASAGELYAAYAEWATANGLRALSNVRFGRALGERALVKERSTGGRYEYRGVGLLTD